MASARPAHAQAGVPFTGSSAGSRRTAQGRRWIGDGIPSIRRRPHPPRRSDPVSNTPRIRSTSSVRTPSRPQASGEPPPPDAVRVSRALPAFDRPQHDSPFRAAPEPGPADLGVAAARAASAATSSTVTFRTGSWERGSREGTQADSCPSQVVLLVEEELTDALGVRRSRQPAGACGRDRAAAVARVRVTVRMFSTALIRASLRAACPASIWSLSAVATHARRLAEGNSAAARRLPPPWRGPVFR
jgi:hypothetical protein